MLAFVLFSRKNPENIGAVVGQLNLIQPDPDEKRLQAVVIHVHPQFDSETLDNDIALIKVNPVI